MRRDILFVIQRSTALKVDPDLAAGAEWGKHRSGGGGRAYRMVSRKLERRLMSVRVGIFPFLRFYTLKNPRSNFFVKITK